MVGLKKKKKKKKKGYIRKNLTQNGEYQRCSWRTQKKKKKKKIMTMMTYPDDVSVGLLLVAEMTLYPQSVEVDVSGFEVTGLVQVGLAEQQQDQGH